MYIHPALAGDGWSASDLLLPNNTPVALPPSLQGPHLDLELTFAPAQAPVTGLLVRSWQVGAIRGIHLGFRFRAEHVQEVRS